jgi:N-acetylglucosaminyldiphosphoundecaprenol N-acetyl-beta-D-mannosaminyltransferase
MTGMGAAPLPAKLDPHPLARRKGDLLGIKVSTIDMGTLQQAIDEAVRDRTRLAISFVNPNYVMRAHADADLRARMNTFDIMLADGWGVVWGARLLGVPIPTRLANDDVGEDLFRQSAAHGYRTFLFGSAHGIAERAAEKLTRAFPGLPIVGTLHGYFDVDKGHPGWYDDQDEALIVETINAVDPDIVWVGVPTPIQQRWVTGNLDKLVSPVIITGGSYLDHLAERINWYPRWITAMRLGWLYRLLREPGRLWYRYSVELLRYGRLIARERLARSVGGRSRIR